MECSGKKKKIATETDLGLVGKHSLLAQPNPLASCSNEQWQLYGQNTERRRATTKNQGMEESLTWILKLDSHIIHVSQSMQTNPLLKRHAYHVHCHVQPLMPANDTVLPQYPAPLVKKIATTNAPFHKTLIH